MDCPRCAAPNLPGLPTCVDCGQDLHAQPLAPRSYVPEVAPTNPLRERRPRSSPPPGVVASGLEHVGRLRQLPWQAFIEGLRGMGTGVVPGLLPALRGDRRGAALQLGLVVGAVVVALSLGGGLEGLARYGWLVACAWSFSPASECQRRMNVPQPARAMVAFWLVLPATLVVALLLPILVRGEIEPVFHYGMGQSLLPAGQYIIDDTALETLMIGELVLLEREDSAAREARFLQLVRASEEPWSEERAQAGLRAYRQQLEQFVVFPVVVVALEGQLLRVSSDGFTVDDVPSDVLPVHTWPREPLAQDLRGAVVPPGQVAVWDWIPVPSSQSLHVNLVPRDRLVGRLTRPIDGQADREPVPWPPTDPEILEVP